MGFRSRSVRYIPQVEATECGAASLAMVLDYHGAPTPLVEVREACGVGRDGVSAARIVRAAEELGLSSEGVRAEVDDLSTLPLPAILHWEFNHFVVLERSNDKRAIIMDPAHGRRTITRTELGRAFTGVALTFRPTSALKARKRKSSSFRRYSRALLTQPTGLGMILGAAAIAECCALLLPAANQVLIDHVLVPQRERWFWPLAASFAATSLVMLALSALRDRVLRRLQFAVDTGLVTSLVEHMLRLPLGFFQQRAEGDLLARVDAQRQLRDVTMRATTALLDALLVVTYAALMLAYDPKTGGVALALCVLRVACSLLLRPAVRQAAVTELTQRGRELGAAVDALAAPEMVKALAVEDVLLMQYQGRLAERLNTSVARERWTSRASAVGGLVDALSQATILWIGGSAVIAHDMTLGVFASFVTLQSLLLRPLQSAVDALFELTYARSVLARIDDLFEATPVTAGERVVEEMRSEIRFESVSFRYGATSPTICENLTLTIRKGEKIAVVGRSGQGKSTFLKLLLGLLTPTSGRITVDGVDIRELDRAAWLKAVGVVLQESFFFRDSIRENLSMHDPNVSLETMRWACSVACIDDAIQRLPEGYETELGENGGRLSGGQRQRLSLARALCRRPSLLVLDEATSSLDAETEARLHTGLARLGCTRVLIAHRLATVADADRILVFDAGRIVQQGRFDELADKPGLFQQFVGAQA